MAEIRDKARPEALALYQGFLAKNKMFFTKERAVLLDCVLGRDDHFSADELMFEIQKAQIKVSRATLYRSLSQMVEAGILAETDFGHGHTHYEVSLGSKPHVHFICQETGEVREVHSDKLEKDLADLARREGFLVKQCKIQVFGISKKARKGRT